MTASLIFHLIVWRFDFGLLLRRLPSDFTLTVAEPVSHVLAVQLDQLVGDVLDEHVVGSPPDVAAVALG